jgi:hypothetical protein
MRWKDSEPMKMNIRARSSKLDDANNFRVAAAVVTHDVS